MAIDVESIPGQFAVDLSTFTTVPITLGHINQTYKVMVNGIPAFLLQQINHTVFEDVDALMQNTRLVLNTLEAAMASHSDGLLVPKLILTKTGASYFKDEEGKYWRMLTFIAGSKTIESVRKYSDAYEGGRAYGLFLVGVSGLQADKLSITIPDFHSLEVRLKAFQKAIELNPAGRKNEAAAEIEFALSMIGPRMCIPDLIAAGSIPTRIVHNDTKFNNLIFSNHGKAIAVVDLDTVMPGSALFDFGDAIRTAANKAREDEANLKNVKFDISIFEAFAAGYIESTEHLLSPTELENFPEAALFMTYIIGIRFLTDFLNGDVYFQTRYPNHNLIRARVQFELLRKMQQKLTEMSKVINRISARLIAEKT